MSPVIWHGLEINIPHFLILLLLLSCLFVLRSFRKRAPINLDLRKPFYDSIFVLPHFEKSNNHFENLNVFFISKPEKFQDYSGQKILNVLVTNKRPDLYIIFERDKTTFHCSECNEINKINAPLKFVTRLTCSYCKCSFNYVGCPICGEPNELPYAISNEFVYRCGICNSDLPINEPPKKEKKISDELITKSKAGTLPPQKRIRRHQDQKDNLPREKRNPDDSSEKIIRTHETHNLASHQPRKSASITAKEQGVSSLFHITHQRNLPTIFQQGLKSYNNVRLHNNIAVDISDPEVQRRRDRIEPIYFRSIHDYVPLYFNPRNPMLYVRQEIQNELVILEISIDILDYFQFVFSDGNAACRDTEFFEDPSDLKKLNWEVIRGRYWFDKVDGKRIVCAETLVFPEIPFRFITRIHLNQSRRFAFLPSYMATVSPQYYF